MIHANHYLVIRKITKQVFFVCGAPIANTLCRVGEKCEWIAGLNDMPNGGARDYALNLFTATEGELSATWALVAGKVSVLGDSRLSLYDTTLAVMPVQLVRNAGGVYEWVPETEKSVDVSSTSGWANIDGDWLYLSLEREERRQLISDTSDFAPEPW